MKTLSQLKLKQLLLTSATLAIASGCGLTKNMNEMHDATVHMDKTTDAMKDAITRTENQIGSTNEKLQLTQKTTESLNEGMQEMVENVAATRKEMESTRGVIEKLESATQVLGADTSSLLRHTEALYADNRQGSSLLLRKNLLEQMEKASSFEAKAGPAGAYFQAYEFQLYKHFGQDDDAQLLRLQKQGMQEFVYYVAGHHEANKFPISLTTKNNDQKNLLILSAAMDQINENHKRARAADPSMKELSVLSMITDTLSSERIQAINSGESKPEDFEVEILREKDHMVYMLQLRANFMAALVVENMTHLQEPGLISKLKGLGKLLGKYELRSDKFNTTQLKEYAKYMNEAIKARDFLVNNGYEPRIDGKLIKLLRHMNLKFVAPKTLAEVSAHHDAVIDLRNSIKSYLQEESRDDQDTEESGEIELPVLFPSDKQ